MGQKVVYPSKYIFSLKIEKNKNRKKKKKKKKKVFVFYSGAVQFIVNQSV